MHSALVIVLVAILAQSATQHRTLDFEERVRAQRAIEQVHWNHRIWPKENPSPKPPLAAVLSDAAIRARVEDYLRKSNALEAYWKRPITAEQLQAEMDRMAKDTRDPRTLRELFDALDHDPFVIAETLVRQTLADRLIRSWYANDERFHGEPRRKAEAALAACRGVSCMKSMGGEYRETTWQLGIGHRDPSDRAVRLDPEEWSDHLKRLAQRLGGTPESLPILEQSSLEETAEHFVVTAVVSQTSGEVTTATAVWPKIPFDAWWVALRGSFAPHVAGSTGTFDLPALALGGCVSDTWSPTLMTVPEPRVEHTSVWTGTEMIVWGGIQGNALLNSGGRYNPTTDTWVFTSTAANAPAARLLHTAVWTGTQMIVWGGRIGPFETNTGGRYDPSTDTWLPTSTTGAPGQRQAHTAVWTGTQMIIWGGIGAIPNTGSRYNPSTNTWAATPTDANVPAGRWGHTAVWTGTEMIIWGGVDGGAFGTGGRYNPSANAWLPTSTGANVPSARQDHTMVWTGTEMIVWGGYTGAATADTNTGGRYHPASDTWVATSTGAGVPAKRSRHTAVWTGTEMVVWGGNLFPSQATTGGRYQPSTDTWVATSTVNAPAGRTHHTAVWAGTEMIVWGGEGFESSAGGRYDPSTDTWVATATGSALAPREAHTSVWTGAEMIAWGGWIGAAVSSGGRYTPSTDAWMVTSTGPNVPDARYEHTALWTGMEMIVWGGYGSAVGQVRNTGGRYDPSANVWSATSTGPGVPSERAKHTAVWTGTEMIVWGGDIGSGFPSNTGGRYAPSADSWTATATGPGAPSARHGHTAAWTGTEMIVWGGMSDISQGQVNTGGRYDPSANTWVETSTGPGVPIPRIDHTAVWTGAAMIVWGGGPPSSSGGIYCVSACATPATWYQDRDGDGHGSSLLTQLACTQPAGFAGVSGDCDDASAAVHPGASEACNGIDDNCAGGADEGLPTVTWYPDVDGDRYGRPAQSVAAGRPPPSHVRNALDCDDTDRSVLPGGTETCDGERNDCDGSGWPALLDGDSDGIENACESCTDGDGDGWGDPGVPGNSCAPDNCPATGNPGQANADFDEHGDACDPCPNDPLDDMDADALCGNLDNCPEISNASQANTDGDPYGDACDPCPLVPDHGTDDGACDPDTDGDGVPNAADPDDDNDTVPDDDGDGSSDACTGGNRFGCDDNCPLDFNRNQRDRDGDRIGDVCDPTDDLVQGGTGSRTNGGPGFVAGTSTTYTFAWEPENGVLGYNVYRGLLTELPSSYGSCYRNRIVTRFTTLPESPAAGSGFFYLVAPIYPERDGSLGYRSDGSERPVGSACP